VGGAFDRHYRLALLRDGLYFADGQINDEVYVYGSYLQSRMYDKGVTCTQCHEPHSYRLKLKGNALCTQCHNPRGNPIYPSLPRGQYDSATHHFHPPGSDGAACVNCHMPARTYMGVDARRDHSFRIPRPDLSQRLGVPNPCTQGHQEKNAQWAAAEISRRFPGGRANGEHFAMLFSQSERETSGQAGNQLLDLANDPSRPAIVRASALMRFSGAASSVSSKSVQKLLRDQSPLVRMAAIGLHPLLPEAQRVEVLAPLLSDPVQSVRLEAAKAFLGIPQTQIPASARLPLKQAMGEWQRSLMARADFPETQMVLGGVALALRNLPAASRAFGRATEMDPQLVDAWLMLARIEAVQGNREKVVRTLTQALRVNPDNTALRQALAEISP
jgi:predicted CXXCH cytochrome family protein